MLSKAFYSTLKFRGGISENGGQLSCCIVSLSEQRFVGGRKRANVIRIAQVDWGGVFDIRLGELGSEGSKISVSFFRRGWIRGGAERNR